MTHTNIIDLGGKMIKDFCTASICLFLCINVANAQTPFKTFKKNPIPIVVNQLSFEYEGDPYGFIKLDYHGFKEEGEESFGTTSGDWYLKYKAMFDFRCFEPFIGGGVEYTKHNYIKSGYLFRLIDSQIIEDSIPFLLDKYHYNNNDTLRNWNLPLGYDLKRVEKIIKRLGLEHFKFVEVVFNTKKYSKFIEVPEAEQANDNMVSMRLYKYPADVDIFLFNFTINNWEYVESVTVSGDHELELYVLQKFEPRYLKDCE